MITMFFCSSVYNDLGTQRVKWCAINVRLIETDLKKFGPACCFQAVVFVLTGLLTDLFFEKTFQAIFSLGTSQILNVSRVQFLFLCFFDLKIKRGGILRIETVNPF